MRKTLVLLACLCCFALRAQAQDAIDLHQVTVANAPPDVADWPVTVSITELHMSTPAGVSFVTAPVLPDTWNYRIPGWTGDLQYTVWPVVRVNGQWHTSGIIQMWQGREGTGAPILTDFHSNWAYSDRWGALHQYLPQVGDQMGFFLTAGNARDEKAVTSKRERSNVVLVSLPAGDTGSFTFAAGPTPTPTPTPTPSSDLTSLINDLAALKVQVTQANLRADDLQRQVDFARHAIDDTQLEAGAARTKAEDLLRYLQAHPLPDGCRVSFLGCRLTFNTPPPPVQ